ncbi:glutamyl-tRNA reductase [Desulfonatronovibrio magnus]|uniref:glutamyl-tRNA reductase n=1 Tax=Desulfonatronovibrio magnus TaxID=698827 RepID=UPI0005EB2643|nr:glutamyl-tRNA reductase [Desulfonatronovibrio magnus]
MEQRIYLFGLNHKTADVEIREKYALSGFNPREQALINSQGPVGEALILSTCNRVEVLCVGNHDREEVQTRVLATWSNYCGQSQDVLRDHIYVHEGQNAVHHLFSVASSLDSMVLGEPQILGQLKDAYRKAVKEKSAGVIVNRLLHKSFSAAKRIRTETAVSSSAVSISYAAVELAKKIFGELQDQSAMLIGAGEMAELAAMHLLNSGLKTIMVANRTPERARELADKFQGESMCMEKMLDNLHRVDIVISSTGAQSTIINASQIKNILRQRRHRPMFFIDIAVPRDIDPDVNSLDSVYLYDIDDLREVVEENLAGRREEAARAMDIVKEEADKFEQWLQSLDLSPTIVDMLNHGESIARKELKKSLRSLGPDVDEQTRAAMEQLSQSLVKKLYHAPIVFLKRRSREEGSAEKFIDLARRFFNLDDENIPPDTHQNRKRN